MRQFFFMRRPVQWNYAGRAAPCQKQRRREEKGAFIQKTQCADKNNRTSVKVQKMYLKKWDKDIKNDFVYCGLVSFLGLQKRGNTSTIRK